MNENIRFKEVLLIDEGSQTKMPTSQAQQLADSRNLDLVVVQATAEPPVARVMDWGKAKFEQSKKQKESKKNQKVIQTKEVRMSPVIDSGDFETRKKATIKFLEQGYKVKLNLRFKGRMMSHQDVGREVLERMADQLKDIAEVEQRPKLEGRQMFLLLAAKPGLTKSNNSKKDSDSGEEKNAKDEN